MPNPSGLRHLDPLDRLFVGIVRQAIYDYRYVKCERQAAHVFLHSLGLIDQAGEVRATEDTALTFGV
jgi:hypothetical protein